MHASNSSPCCTRLVEQVVECLNIVDPLVSKPKLIGDLSPLVDELPIEDKGRVAVGLLEIVAEFVEQLEGALALFANRFPRGRREEDHG
jgi:hypothetical protein